MAFLVVTWMLCIKLVAHKELEICIRLSHSFTKGGMLYSSKVSTVCEASVKVRVLETNGINYIINQCKSDFQIAQSVSSLPHSSHG